MTAGPVTPPTVQVMASTPIVRRGLVSILSDDGWLVIDHTRAPEATSDVVVWELPQSSNVGDVTRMRERLGGRPLVIIAAGVAPDDLASFIAAGAQGALDREVEEAVLTQSVRAVAAGRTVVNAGMRPEPGAARPPALTRRESQVLGLLCAGRTNHEIAEALIISDNTVKNHVRRLYEKLQVRSRTEAVVRAARWGIVRIDGEARLPP